MITCPYNCGFYHDDMQLLVCRPTGDLTADHMNDIAVCRDCIQAAGLTQINRFHDLTGITSVSLSFNDVNRIAFEESLMRKSSSTIKACYLVPNALLYGTIRMYAALIESSGVAVHVGYDIDAFVDILEVDRAILESDPV